MSKKNGSEIPEVCGKKESNEKRDFVAEPSKPPNDSCLRLACG